MPNYRNRVEALERRIAPPLLRWFLLPEHGALPAGVDEDAPDVRVVRLIGVSPAGRSLDARA